MRDCDVITVEMAVGPVVGRVAIDRLRVVVDVGTLGVAMGRHDRQARTRKENPQEQLKCLRRAA